MSAEENKAIFTRFANELMKGNFAIVDEVCAPDFAFHSPNFPGWPRGLEGARQLATSGESRFADAETTIDDLFAAEDRVVMRMTLRGTYIGEPQIGFPKEGERFVMGLIAIYRFANGKIVDDWGVQVACPKQSDLPWG